ncbi:MAG TPA: AlkA N-terminal domain-containing protein [Woeseiaceae bacterium]|nr:AlkA N-terminal domain-containing protein [Woeseiaceae bacterium]
MLQNEIYERARLARDPRFDGQFYIAVKTTGIYCRPICPVMSPKRENITYFPSAAAASEAGYRPCLRCRPECAPGTPAWGGTSTTVRRGLRLIAGGALDEGNVEKLADRLGVTSRHLRRLFTKHLGASPLAVAHTQRLHFAKRLIDDTTLPMTHISAAAGYRSVRRFNDAFIKTYGRPPRELRKVRINGNAGRKSPALVLRLPYRAPFNWQAMLQFFAHRATPGVEHVDGDTYRRTIAVNDEHGVVEVRPGDDGYLSMTLHRIRTNALFEVIQRMRELFDLDAPVAEIGLILERDSKLRAELLKHPGIRVPGAYNGFELTVRAILGQQVSVKAATTLAGRIAARYGEPLRLSGDADPVLSRVFPTPERLRLARLNNMGLVGSRIETIRRVAAATARGEVNFDPAQDPDTFCAALTSIKGVGDWTAQYVAMRVLKYPDAFPATDLGLLKALTHPERTTPAVIRERAEAWRPYRAYAAMLMWNSLPAAGG